MVIVSADATPWQVERLRRAGADAYLTKPLLAEQFLRCVGELLGAAPVCPAPAAHPDPAT